MAIRQCTCGHVWDAPGIQDEPCPSCNPAASAFTAAARPLIREAIRSASSASWGGGMTDPEIDEATDDLWREIAALARSASPEPTKTGE